jgi:hypothetical protein
MLTKQLRGDAAYTEIAGDDDAVTSWRISAWDMIVKLVATDGGLKVVAVFGAERFEQELTGS